MIESIIVALISGICVTVPFLIATIELNGKNQSLLEYRLKQLEEKVNKHNQIVVCTYKLEDRCNVFDEKIKVANHRIDDLESK